MKHFFIITISIPQNESLIMKIKEAIEAKGGTCGYMENPRDAVNLASCIRLPKDTECIITIGGDGTLIRAAQNTSGSNVPMIGLNRGHLGYLCDLDEETIFPALDKLMEEKYEIEDRMLLSGYLVREGNKECGRAEALNDIVIVSEEALQVINLTVYINGQYLYSYNCDGMIFATPTGSTAYNLSANGPIVDPKTNLILLTPINPHALNSRSIVLDSEDEISVEITPRREGEHPVAMVSFDGNHRQPLREGERLVVHKAAARARIIRLSKMNFLERISHKMQTN